MGGRRVKLAGILALGAAILLALGFTSYYEISKLRSLGAPGVSRGEFERAEAAETGMGYMFGAAALGLGAYLLMASERRSAAADRDEADCTGEHEREIRELRRTVRHLRDRLEADEGTEDEKPDTPRIGVDDLVRDLDHENAGVRREAAEGLRAMGPEGASAHPALEAVLARDDEDLGVLRAAALAIVAIAANPDGGVDAVSRRLASPDPKVRDWAAVTLGKIGPPAMAATGALKAVLGDPIVGRTAKEALRRIGGEVAPV